MRCGEKCPLGPLPAANVPDDMAISSALVTHITMLGLDNTANGAVMPNDRAKRLVKPTPKVQFPGPAPKISHNRQLASRGRRRLAPPDRRLRPSAFDPKRSSGSAERAVAARRDAGQSPAVPHADDLEHAQDDPEDPIRL